MQPYEREHRGRHRLGAAQKARFHRTRIGDPLQVEHVSAQRSHQHDGHERGQTSAGKLHVHRPRLHDKRRRRSPEQHGQARHEHRAPFRQHPHGHERVKRQRHGRHETPGQALDGYGEAARIALRGDDRHAAEREHEARRLPSARQTPRAQTHVQHDDHEPHLLDGGANPGRRVADGVEVAELRKQHAEHGEGRDARERAPVAQHRHEVAPVAHCSEEQEEHGGDDHAHAGDPRGGSAVVAHQQLGARSREPPAHSSRERARHAPRHMAALGRRTRLRHLIDPLARIGASCVGDAFSHDPTLR